jgi:hypothetical protein
MDQVTTETSGMRSAKLQLLQDATEEVLRKRMNAHDNMWTPTFKLPAT